MIFSRAPKAIDWSKYLNDGEAVIWTGSSNFLSMLPSQILVMAFFGACAYEPGKDLFIYKGIADACGQTPSTACTRNYHMAWPLFVVGIGFVALATLTLVGNACGFLRTYFAVTNTRALQVGHRPFGRFLSVDLKSTLANRSMLGGIRFGTTMRPKLLILGLTESQIEAAWFWIQRGQADK